VFPATLAYSVLAKRTITSSTYRDRCVLIRPLIYPQPSNLFSASQLRGFAKTSTAELLVTVGGRCAFANREVGNGEKSLWGGRRYFAWNLRAGA